jgi:cytochrome c2
MPDMRLQTGRGSQSPADENGAAGITDEALDIAIYLADIDPPDHTTALDALFASHSEQALMQEQQRLMHLLDLSEKTHAESPSGRRSVNGIGESNSQKGLWADLGRALIEHYGCHGCHTIPGCESLAAIGPEHENWGIKPIAQLDFGSFSQPAHKKHVPVTAQTHPKPVQGYWRNTAEALSSSSVAENASVPIRYSRSTFAIAKVRNPHIFDRSLDKAPYAWLRMPKFAPNDEQASALACYLLSRRPSRVEDAGLQDAHATRDAAIADGRQLTRRLNCIGCHQIDGNASLIHQYFWVYEGGDWRFDRSRAPGPLYDQGARVNGAWMAGYLQVPASIRPTMAVHMPAYDLNPEEVSLLAEFFAMWSDRQSQWLAAKLPAIADATFEQGQKGGSLETISAMGRGRTYTVAALIRFLQARALTSITSADDGSIETLHGGSLSASIRLQLNHIRDAASVESAFVDPPAPAYSPSSVADGQLVVQALKCLQCHAHAAAGTGAADIPPIAPQLENVSKRLRRRWTDVWLRSPRSLRPGTKMPSFFSDKGSQSAFVALPEQRRQQISNQLNDAAVMDQAEAQREAILAFLWQGDAAQWAAAYQDLMTDR